MKFIVDTHFLIWWFLDAPQLPLREAELITEVEKGGGEIGFSIISFWEIAKLAEKGRMGLLSSLEEFFARLENHPTFKILPLTGKIIRDSTRLGPRFQKDPADQLIVATARSHGLHLMTVDDQIIDSKVVAIA